MDNEKRDREAIVPDKAKNPISEEPAKAQWELLEEEYCIDEDPEGVIGEAKKLFLRAIQQGRIEICEDPKEGVIVRQFLRRSPLKSGEKTLTYRAPDASHIATTGVGKTEDRTNVMRWVSLAAAITNANESSITKLKGGDRSIMETIAQLFLHV